MKIIRIQAKESFSKCFSESSLVFIVAPVFIMSFIERHPKPGKHLPAHNKCALKVIKKEGMGLGEGQTGCLEGWGRRPSFRVKAVDRWLWMARKAYLETSFYLEAPRERVNA